ncbi:uncharacterized protein [Amphiura filiformis]|uniref:uncharacterized protein n=1 Tax=Amphiura filiformis TaxID=82378 RepID=UPI003B21941B
MAMYLRWTFLLVAVLAVTPTVNSGCSVGQRVVNRAGKVANVRIAMVLVNNVISCNGVIASWQYWPKQSFPFKAIVFRQVLTGTTGGSTSTWNIIGINDIPASNVIANRVNRYNIPTGDRIEVQTGDVIGIAHYDDGPVIAADAADASNPGTFHQVVVNSCQLQCRILTESEIGNLEVGSTITTVSTPDIWQGSTARLQVSLSAEVIVPPVIVPPDSTTGCSVGQRVVNRAGKLSNVRIAMVLINNAISCNGVIASWQYWPKQSFPFKVIVFRQVLTGTTGGSTSTWNIIGINDIPASNVIANRVNIYNIPTGDRIEVQTGDVIGIAHYDDGPVIAADAADASNPGTFHQVAVNSCHFQCKLLTEFEIGNLEVGRTITTVSTTDIFVGSTARLQVSLSAEVIVSPHSTTGSQGNGASHYLYQSWMTMAIFFASVSTIIYLY